MTNGGVLKDHMNVICALMLRDIKTRSGASYFGFLVGIIVPFGHIAVLLVVYAVLGRRAPIGTDVTSFLTTAILPFVVWTYTHQKVSFALSQNYGLTFFPIVKLIDIILARFLVEILNSTLVIVSTAVVLYSFVPDVFIFDVFGFVFALMLSCLLGLSTGFVFGFLSLMYSIIALAAMLLVPIYWITSGTFFIPDALPSNMIYIVSFFPLSHIIDYGRTKFYAMYISDYADLRYVFGVIIMNFNIGMLMIKFKNILLNGK